VTLSITRASTAYQRGSDGTWTSVGNNVLRDAHYVGAIRTTRLDRATTNFLLNSGTPSTQTVSLNAGTYTLWVTGGGSCLLNGGPTGTATEGSPARFTLGGTTSVGFHVSGSLGVFQCEDTPDPTAYIATAGASVTQTADLCNLTMDASLQTSTLYLNLYELAKKNQFDGLWAITDTAGNTPRAASWQGSSSSRIRSSMNAGGGDQESADNATDILWSDHVETRYIITPTQVGMGISINGGAESSIITSGVVSSVTTWDSGSNVRLHLGIAPWGLQGRKPMSVAGVALATGIQDMATMRLLAGPLGVSALVSGTATNAINENDIVAGGKTIVLTLSNDNWVSAGATFDGQRQNIIDGIVSAQAEPHGWNAERSNISVGAVTRTSATVATITLPALANYNTATGETLTISIPGTAVSGGNAITASPTITIDEVADFTSTQSAAWVLPVGMFIMGGQRALRVRTDTVDTGHPPGEGTQ